MTLPMTLLSAGAALGIGAFAVPIVGSALAKPITGESVPTRLTDLGSYLFAASARGLSGIEDEAAQQSIGEPAAAVASPTVNAPERFPVVGEIEGGANTETKRMLAAASFASGLLIAGVSFILIRRALR